MIPKYPGTNVPAHSTYVSYLALDPGQVRTWHAVCWPRGHTTEIPAAYTYADDHFTHAWTVNKDMAYFEDASEAVQFALLFGGAS